MAKKEFFYRGKSTEELRKMSLSEIALLLPARQRRKIKRGFSDVENKILNDLKGGKKSIKTHCRSMIVLPQMFGAEMKIFNGKEFVSVLIQEDMLGHYFGEFALTRKPVRHSAPGIGASRSSASASVK